MLCTVIKGFDSWAQHPSSKHSKEYTKHNLTVKLLSCDMISRLLWSLIRMVSEVEFVI